MMAQTVYILCGIFSVTCALLLFKSYKQAPSHLLFWSGLCFGFLAINNIILFVDIILFPQFDFNGALLRSICVALAGVVLLFGLIWELT